MGISEQFGVRDADGGDIQDAAGSFDKNFMQIARPIY